MAENITTYELKAPQIPISMDRDEFYDEQIKVFNKTGKPTRACGVINLLLFTTDGEMILQKRSYTKNHNPSLIDKAVGGHIKHGDSPFYTLMVETIQELQAPSIVLQTPDEFKKTYKLLDAYLEQIAVIKFLDEKIVELSKVFKNDKKEVIIANKVYLFIGVYGGSTKPVDKEVSGVLYYNLDILREEIKNSPNDFTADIKFYLKEYKEEINNFLKEVI